MSQCAGQEFETDTYMEGMLVMRRLEPVWYRSLPEAVKKVLEEYEREKLEAEAKLRLAVN
jgi:hypothetical protein